MRVCSPGMACSIAAMCKAGFVAGFAERPWSITTTWTMMAVYWHARNPANTTIDRATAFISKHGSGQASWKLPCTSVLVLDGRLRGGHTKCY